jgi:hypothetical protein
MSLQLGLPGLGYHSNVFSVVSMVMLTLLLKKPFWFLPRFIFSSFFKVCS